MQQRPASRESGASNETGTLVRFQGSTCCPRCRERVTGAVRITGGTKRGRRLAPLTIPGIRPTSDRAREAVFNMLGRDLTGYTVLDLFAGTGAFGIDALSRGAASAVFVDSSPGAVELIARNIGLCGFQRVSSVVKADLTVGIDLGDRPGTPARFDVIFIDPPYRSGLVPRLCRQIVADGLLKPGGCVVAETGRNETLSGTFEGLVSGRVRTYGDTKISIFLCEGEQ